MIKFRYFIIMFLIIISSSYSQIQTTDFPKEGFEKRIANYVDDIWIIDTHEHLLTEEERIQKADKLDFTYLFSQYTIEDLISASNEHGLMGMIFTNSFPLEDRWELFKPFLKEMRNTGYARATLMAARDIYGVEDINDDTYALLSQKIKDASKPGLYREILKEKAKIELSIMDGGHRRFDKEFYRHVERFDQFINISSIAKIKELGSHYKVDIKSLDDFQKALRIAFEEGVSYEMVGVKSGLAYNRIIKYDNTQKEQALSIFKKLQQQESVSKIEIKAIQDYMMHRVLDLADEYKLPVQIHTGLLSGNGNYITNSKPTHLTNLFMEYPQVNFCLFHSSYPYGAELSVLAKSFPNVFIDMTWSAVISPAYSIRFLDEWLETVPANKIMAFGGDYSIVELSYAHSVFARRIVSKVLIGKVRSGYLSEEEAKYVAKKILRDNALEIFKLKGHSRGLKNIEALNRPGRLHDWWVIHNSSKGIIHDWKIIGPFPFGSGLDEIYPPEEELDFDKSYDGMDRTVTWRSVKTGESGYLNFVAMYSENNSDLVAMAYAYTEVISPDERDITLTLGSNDGAKVWLNGKEIFNLHIPRGAVADQEFLSVHLKKGVNKILAKVENLGSNWGLYMRVVDPNEELKIKEFD